MSSIVGRVAICCAMCIGGSPVLGQLIIGHRGASHDAPENTLAAFRLALEQGADGFECDFYLTQDGHIVCLHDEDTERVAGKRLVVTKTPFDELRRLDVGRWKGPQWQDERMPTLGDALVAVPLGKKIYVELKSKAKIVEPMAKVIASCGLAPEQIVIISFHEDAIAEAKKQLPQLKACWITGFKKQDDGSYAPTADEVIAALKRTHADAVDCQAVPEHFNEAFIKRLRDAGYGEFHIWTVDDPQVARLYRGWGVASITTNRPGWLREQLAKPESIGVRPRPGAAPKQQGL